MDWKARRAAVVNADGEDWDELHEAFEWDWKAAYAAAFVEIAVSRGWGLEDAESWDIADEALMDGAPDHGYDPRRTAEADVIACEIECGNA